MSSVDNRIVEMQFNNRRFEENARETMSTLDKLKEKLSFKSSTKEMEDFQHAADSFNLSRIAEAIEGIGNKFTMLGNLGQAAMQRIANAAINAGTQLVKSISVDQIGAGMTKYEQETNVIQTIYGALKPKGVELEQIYDTMEKLTAYSDETSYSYTQMADAISKFVNAGVELNQAETVIEGISNAAAKAGIGIHETAIIYRNFSDAIAKGGFRLQDWNSISIAHMDTQWLKDAFIEEAINLGKLDKSGRVLVKAEKRNAKGIVTAAAEYKNVRENFKDTLSKGWLDNEVITAVMLKYANRGLAGFGEEAFKAAQNAKTFTDVLDAVKDAASTGWSRSFRIIFGDLNEAIALFTPMADRIIKVVNAIDEARNEMLGRWKEFGGRDSLINAVSTLWDMITGFGETLTNVFKGVFSVTKFIKRGIGTIYTGGRKAGSYWETIGDILQIVTKNLEEGTKAFKDWFTPKRMNMIYYGLNGVLSILRGVILAVKGAFQFFGNIFEQLKPAFDPLLDLFAAIGADIGYAVYQADSANNVFTKLAKKLANIFTPITSRLPKVIEWVGSLYLRIRKFWNENERFVAFRKTLVGVFSAFIDFIPNAIESFIQFGKASIKMIKDSDEWKWLVDNYNKYIKPFVDLIADSAIEFNKYLTEFFSIDTSGESTLWGKIKKRFSVFDGLGPWLQKKWDNITKHVPWLRDLTEWWNTNDIVKGIREWIGAISSAIDTFLSTDTSGNSSIVGKLKMRFEKMWDEFGPWVEKKWDEYKKKYPILQQIEDFLKPFFGQTEAIEKGAEDAKESAKNTKTLFNQIIDFITGIDFGKLAAFGVAIKVMIDLYKKIKGLFGWVGIGESISDTIEEVGKTIKSFRKSMQSSRIAALSSMIISIGVAMLALGITLEKVAKLSWEEIGRGLTAMAGLFVETGAFMIITSKFGSTSIFKRKAVNTTNMIGMAAAMYILGIALERVAALNWDEIGRGLTAMGGLFLETGAFMVIVNAFGSTSILEKKGVSATGMVSVAVAMYILGMALERVSALSWDRIGSGLTAMAGLFLETGAFMVIVNAFGSTSILKNKGASASSISAIAIAIEKLANTLKKLAAMTWEEIGRGLAAMAGLFAETGIFMILVNRLGSVSILKKKGLSTVGMLSTVASISILAEKLKQLAELQWDEIARGLVAMAGIFVEEGAFMAIIGFLSKKDMIKPDAVNATAGILAGGIGMVADGMAKLAKLQWDEIWRGIASLGLIEVALGLFMVIMGKAKKLVKITQGISMAAVAGAIWVLVQAFMPLTTINWSQFATGIASLASVAVVLGLFCFAMSAVKVSIKTSLSVIISAIAMAGLMVAFAFALTLIKDIDVNSILAFAEGLAMVVIALAGAAKTLQMLGSMNIGTALKGALVMVIAGAALGAAVSLILMITSGAVQDFSNTIAMVGANLAQYSDMVADIDMDAVQNSVTMIKDLAAAFVEVGAKNYGDLETFKTNLSRMSSAFKIYYLNIAPIDLEHTKSATEAIQYISVVFAEIGGKEYGNLELFKSNMTRMGSSLKIFALNTAAVSIEMVTAIIGLLKDISNAFVEIGGKEYGNIETFRTTMSRMSSSAKIFNTNAAEFDLEKMKATTEALKTMATDLAGFPEVSDVSTSIGNIGGAIKLYASSLNGVDLSKAPDTTAIKTVFDTLKGALPDDENLTDVAAYASEDKGAQMTNFAIGLTNIATAVSDFAKSTEGMNFDQIDKAIEALNALDKLNTQTTITTISSMGDFTVETTTQVEKGNFDTFAADIVSMGVAVADFGNSVADTDFSQVDKAVAALAALNTLNTGVTTTTVAQLGDFSVTVTDQVSKGNFDTFATDIVSMGVAVADFGNNVKDIDFSQVDKAVAALVALNTLNTELGKTTIVKFGPFALELSQQTANMTNFSTDIISLGTALKDFGSNVGTVDTEQMGKSVDVLKKIVDVNNALPPTGGISQWINGTKTLSGFAAGLRLLGNGAKEFSLSIKDGNFDTDEVKNAGDVLIKIAEVNNKLPPTGGISSWFTGDESLGGFGNNLRTLGEGIAGFTEALGNTKVTDDIDDAVAMLSRIASIQIRLSGKESWYSMTSLGSELKEASNYISAANENIAGKTWASESEMKSFEDLLTFAETQTGNLQGTGWENMSTAAMYLNDAADYIVETNGKLIAVENWADTTSFINLLNQAVDMQIRLGDTKYTKNLKDLGTNIKDFYNEVDSISAVFLGRDNNKLDQITNSITSIFGALNEMYSNLDANGEFTISGENIINSILGGMKSDNSTKSIVSAGNQLSMRIVNTVRQNDQNFRNVGTWIPAGLARGIEDNSAAVINKVQSMMQSTIDVAMKTIDAHSPSKEFYEIGNYAVMGLTYGFDKNAIFVRKASKDTMMGAMEASMAVVEGYAGDMTGKINNVAQTVVNGINDNINTSMDGVLENVLGDFASAAGLDYDSNKLETDLVITPVWDGQGFRVIGDELEAVKEGTKSVSIDTGVKIDTGKVESKWSSVSALQDIAANRKQDQMLYDINKRIDKLQGTIEHTQVVLDTGVLVGEMTSDIDKSLGNKSTLSGRGN